ncbi:BamA/TamA family outer membrane protein [Maribacter sp.]|nr:BamA/TamA family outer membrane protein [Maribacter sp.]
MKKTRTFIGLLILLVPAMILAQKEPKKVRDSTKNVKITALPVIFYTPETALGFGGLGLATFRLKDEEKNTRPSSVQLGVSYTTKKQLLIFAPFEIYKDDERWRMEGELGYYRFFYNFFGLGIDSEKENEEVYEVNFPRLRLNVLREVLPNFSVGLGYEFDSFGDLTIVEEGALDNADVSGKRDGIVSNLGVLAFYDTRDNIFFPTKGWFLQGNFFTSSKLLGASFNYSKFELDSRFYQKVGKKQVLAANLFLANSSKSTPFYDLYYLGSKRTRGFANRRFQDNAELSFVTEYRFPIKGRFGGVVFGSTGTVAPDLGKTLSSKFKNAAGAGLRYIVNKRDGVRIRVDYGYTNEGGNFYFTIKEAF